MSIDRLTAELRSGGTAAGEGGFSLDREKAREKLRQFQLADPHRWVLLVIQALVDRGATTIEVDIDADDVRVNANGTPLSNEDFEEMYSSLYSSGRDRPGLRELALASNAAMALNPRYLRIESGDGRTGVRLELRVGADDRIETLASAPAGTRVHAKERFRPGLIVRFLRRRDGVLPEQVLVRERCRWADVDIALGDERVSAGISTMLPGAVEVAAAGLRGWLAFDPTGGPGLLVILRFGVLVAQHQLPSPSFVGARAVLVGDRMRTDASMSDVVRDEHFEAWLVALAAAHEMAVTAMLAASIASGTSPGPQWIAVVRERLATWLAAGATADSHPTLAPWWQLPMWRTLAGAPSTTAQLHAQAGEIRISGESVVEDVPREVGGILLVDEQDRAALTAMFGKRVTDRTQLVRRAVARRDNRKAWLRRPHAPRLPDEHGYTLRVPVNGEGLVGEVGICADGAQRSLLRVVLDGCMLVELPVELGLPAVHAVVEGRFHPNHMHDSVAKDGRFVPAALAVVAAVDTLARMLAEAVIEQATVDEVGDRTLTNYLHALVEGKLALNALVSLGVDKNSAQKHVETAAMPWAFDRARDLVEGSTHPLLRMPFTTDGAGASVSLCDVVAAFARDGVVRVIALRRPNLSEPPLFVVRAGERKLEVMRALFGTDAVALVGAEYERWIAREERLARLPAERLAIDRCIVGPVEFVDGPHLGVVGLLAADPDLAERHARVTVMVDRRRLCDELVPCGIPGIALAIDVVPDLADARFEELADRRAVESLSRTALVGVEALIAATFAAIETTQTVHAGMQPFALAIARIAWPVPVFFRAWTALRAELGDDEGTQAYGELLDLLEHHELEGVIGAIHERLEQSVVPLPQIIGPALAGRTKPVAVPWTGLRRAAISTLHIAVAVPCLRTLGGSLWPLQRVVDARAAGTVVRWVAHDLVATIVTGFEDVLAIDRYRREVLAAFVGDAALLDVTNEIELEARRHSFEQRAELDDLVLEDGRAIIRFAVQDGTTRGELGIPARSPSAGDPAAVLVCRGRRPIQSIDPQTGFPWVGVLGGDFGRDTGFERISEADRGRIADVCVAAAPAALRAIARNWRALPLESHAIIREWALQLLAMVAPRTGAEPVALAERGIAELATLPLFVDVAGNVHTLDALHVDWRANGDVVFAREPGRGAERIVVLVRTDAEITALAAVFGSARDHAHELARRAALEARLAASPWMPTPPADALSIFAVEGRGLVGQLWIDDGTNDESAVMFGRDGRVVGEMRISSMFPCRGAVTGPGLEIADDWTGFELTGPQQNQLKNDACSLWEELVHTTAKATEFDERRARPLRNLLLRLHAIPTAGRSWPNHDQRKLYRELQKIPLFVVGERAIDLVVALREKPAALDRLGLWNPADREVADVPTDPVSPAAPVEPPPPTPEIAPTPPMDPHERLLAAVRDELRLVRAHAPALLAEIHLERIATGLIDGSAIAAWENDAVVIDTANRVVQRALDAADARLVAVLASAVFTTINCALEDVTDANELDFLRWHAAHARTAPSSPRAKP